MKEITLRTGARTDFVDLTPEIQSAVSDLGLTEGVIVVFNPHTTAAVTINEGADPSGRPYLWLGNFLSDASSERGTDLNAITQGAIGVTPLHMDMTHKATLKKLAGLFE